MNEAGIEAILCLQSDDCLDALGIPFEARPRRGPCPFARCRKRLAHWRFSLGTSHAAFAAPPVVRRR